MFNFDHFIKATCIHVCNLIKMLEFYTSRCFTLVYLSIYPHIFILYTSDGIFRSAV